MAEEKQQRFWKAYEEAHEAFLRYCSALSYGKMDTEDLVQDVLLSAYKNFDKISPEKPFIHYLIRAAKNRKISIWRKLKFSTELIEQQALRLQSKDVAPDKILEIQHLYQTLDRLPKSQKEAIILFEISGFSMREIAEIQNSTEGAIKTKVSRGRTMLKRLLQQEDNHLSTSMNNLKTIML